MSSGDSSRAFLLCLGRKVIIMGTAAKAVDSVETETQSENLEDLNFTKVANVLFDVIFPYLDPHEKCIIMLVIRETVGRHRERAAISNAEFASFAGMSMSATIDAKNRLIASGLLVQEKKGGGLKRSVYGLAPREFIRKYDLDDKIIHIDAKSRESNDHAEALQDPPNSANFKPYSSIPGEPPEAMPPISEKSGDTIGVGGIDTGVNSRVSSSCSHADPYPLETASHKPPERDEAANPMKSSCPPYGEPLEDLLDTSSCDIKTNKEGGNVDKPTKLERKEAFGAVCFSLRSLGSELGQTEYAFIGYCIKTYTVEAVKQKIELMKMQKSRGVPILNPLAWLRTALAKNWSGSVFDLAVEKGRLKAQKADERAEADRKQRLEWEKESEVAHDPEAMKRINAVCAAFLNPFADDNESEAVE